MKYPYALYLDSKILGTAKQLVTFYEQGVFSVDNTIVYLKKYKESARAFSRIFANQGIPFKFMKPRELDALSGQTIFYAFNAQSNCRLVANRSLKHIFITHGESNKVSSIKPIIRIYDHVVMAGRLSLERYYNSGLFDEHDYETGRLIMMGDTFIGRTGFSSNESKESVLFYAPTWEGGLETENYSSLQFCEHVKKYILQICKKLDINSVVIQPHPNLGHRNRVYLRRLVKLMVCLLKENMSIYINTNHINLSIWQKIYLLFNGVKFTTLTQFHPRHALVDISAMESMSINEGIPYNIFYSEKMLRDDLPLLYKKIYDQIGICLNKDIADEDIRRLSPREVAFLKDSLFDYSNQDIKTMNKVDKITTLLHHIGK